MEKIEIKTGGKTIGVIYGGTDLSEAASLLEDEQVFLVYDRNVEGFAGKFPGVKSSLALDVSETLKTLETVQIIADWLLENGANRESVLLAVGGGILTDIAGFAASIYMRGIRFAFIPTTLLSQTDASVGGKTGVNFEGYKNILGVIRQPLFTYICPSPLTTLPLRELLGGVSELLKTFIIDNSGNNYSGAINLLASMAAISAGTGYLSENEAAKLHPFVMAAATVKAGIVGRDQFENGERRKLNLGHTFAHAIEHLATESGDDISHGEAVSMGIILAARLSEKVGIAPEGIAICLESDFKSLGLKTESPYPVELLAPAMTKDKKTAGDEVRFVLIRDIGDVTVEGMSVGKVVKLLQ